MLARKSNFFSHHVDLVIRSALPLCGMTELAFLSVEVENDTDTVEDSSEKSSSDHTNADNTDSGGHKFDENTHSDLLNCSDGKEAVEICQKTVNPNNRVNSENFKIQRVIGKGGYGKVDGVDKGKLYAMKVLKKARLICNEKDKAHTVSERNILQMLRHPFLVKLHYAFQNHSNLYIVLEYCPGGELFNYLEKEGALLENAACFYTAEIILAIGHLHSLGIIYRDLKSENVLLDRQGHVKLTDFGLSKEGVCTTNTFCGTIEYMAPEIIKCEGHGKAVDWWSLGTLLFDMLSGGPPFSQEESREVTTQKILTAPLKFPPAFSPEVISLLRGLLKRDPKERLGSKEDVEEIKRHKFFRRHEINWSDVFNRRLRPPFRPKLISDNDVSMFDPNFTRLQPIVSPADIGRSIPPDMFQVSNYCYSEEDFQISPALNI
ncbi:Non-specific serine/threonine protein kinase [Paragonimus heterotremus]|uniref:Non-specific serine/threonine protein kinase n=1 Tax=Paragonimus heterotremus TaxID=100268 RepID=A0A8J4T0J4_9TREM|nr:Non-specific serine/threonine protein kinase [Paragonimus heterotremus]